MAGPGKDESSNVKKVSKSIPGPSLDVTSQEFNPLEALYSPECVIPHPRVRVFKNVYEYERLTSFDENATDPESVQHEKRQPSSKLSKTAGPGQFRKEGAAPKGMKESNPSELDQAKKSRTFKLRNILTRMEKEVLAGPLSLLQQCLMKKHNVRVWTRSAINIRGVCRGYIVAFDKHYNLAMIDVDEVYRNPTYTKIQRRRLKKKAFEEAEREKITSATSNLSIKSTVHSRLGPRLETGSRDPRSTKHGSASMESSSRDPRIMQRKGVVSSPSTPRSRDQSWGSAYQSRSDSQGRSRQPSGTQNPVLLSESVFMGIHPEELLYRHVNQLFIRGDNVVTVNIISS